MIVRTPSTEDTRPGPDCYPRPATVVAMTVRSWIREHLLTADAIYGLILYSALVAGVSDKNSDATEVLAGSVGTLLIFWAAHVFAKTLAGHEADTGSAARCGRRPRSRRGCSTPRCSRRCRCSSPSRTCSPWMTR